MNSLRFAWLLLGLLFLAAAAWAADIPALRWTERTDWINVKTDASPAAVGDGITDDTAAIQAALNMLDDGNGDKAIYFPPGTYRITSTIVCNKSQGNMMVGCGRDTRIEWDGELGGIMCHSNGFGRSRIIGFVWDGNDLASVGIDHDARTGTYYETRVLHRHLRFENFTADDDDHTPTVRKGAGIRVGHDQQIASAEMTFQNCIFEGNDTGISFLCANDYDNTVDGCEFIDNEYGVYCGIGNFIVRNSTFLRSTICDIATACAHSNSIRRCASSGSRQFFYQPGSSNMTEICIQDCRIDGWTETTYGAIRLDSGGPATIMDCVFTNPPNANPPVRLGNGSYMTQPLITSNNVSTGTTAVVAPGSYSVVTDIPGRKVGGVLTSATQSFIKSRVPAEGTVYDAKRDFGAVANNSTDDTTAIQNCINAARTAGNGAVAYLPNGTYKITGTLNIYGGNYTIAGSGFRTIINWLGATDGTALSVVDPQNVRLEQFQVAANADTVCRIRQTSSTGGSSYMVYDHVFVGGSWLSPQTRWLRGLECDSLPEGAVVLFEEFDGSIDLINCSRARILANVHMDGKIRVRGAAYAKTGFAGWLSRFCSGNDYDLFVQDNQDIVIADWYTEQTTHLASITGDSCTTPGRVTIQSSKQHQYATDHYISINNYTGSIFWGKGSFVKDGQTSCPIVHAGTRACDLVFAGNGFYNYEPAFTLGSGATKYTLANVYRRYDLNPAVYGIVADNPSPFNDTAKAKVAAGLDHLAELGRVDLSLNHPGLVPRTTHLKFWVAADRGVTKDGSDYVSGWADQSGLGNDAFNPGGLGSEEPLYIANALNSKPVIRFDGVNSNFMLGGDYLFADNTKTGITFAAVVKSTADRTNNLAFLCDFGCGSSGGGGYAFTYDLNSAGVVIRKSGAPTGATVYYTHGKGTNYVVYTGAIKFGAGSTGALTTRLNGVQVATTAITDYTQFTATEVDESATRVWSAGPVSLAMQSKGLSTDRNLQGDIAEIVWYDSALSGDSALEVERYLSKKWGVSLDGAADSFAPAAVTNLAVTSFTDTSVTLSWTAPGDDDNVGTATSYDIRYSTAPITMDNWASATQVTGEPTPAAAGTGQNMTVSGLTSLTTYYFAIKAIDENSNASEVSNLVSQQTQVPLGELKLWLKSDAGITMDASNRVATWADQSGQGNDAFCGDGDGYKPVYTANAVNGYPAIRFDGSNDNLILGNKYLFADNTKTGITCFFVLKSTADRTETVAFAFDFGAPCSGGNGYAFRYDLNNAGTSLRTPANTGYMNYYTHSKGSNYVVFTGEIVFGTGTTGSMLTRLNGVQVATRSITDITKITADEVNEYPTRNSSYGPVSLGMQSKLIAADRNLQGDLVEILWYSSAFNGTDARKVEEHLAAKYGITLD